MAREAIPGLGEERESGLTVPKSRGGLKQALEQDYWCLVGEFRSVAKGLVDSSSSKVRMKVHSGT